MIKPENVPEAVWHTAMSTYHKTIKKRPGSAWQEAIAAAINAWPGMGPIRTDQPIGDWCDKLPAIILPLPQKEE